MTTTGNGAVPLVGVTVSAHFGVTSVHVLLQLEPGVPLFTQSSHCSHVSTVPFPQIGPLVRFVVVTELN